MKEEWKDIKGFNRRYQISNAGKIRNPIRGKILKQGVNPIGYNTIFLWDGIKNHGFRVARLVGIYYVRGFYPGLQINHIDGYKSNDHFLNLEWTTPLENVRHAVKMGLHNSKGERQHLCKLTNEKVIKIRELYDMGFGRIVLSKMFMVHRNNITCIVRRETWKHI